MHVAYEEVMTTNAKSVRRPTPNLPVKDAYGRLDFKVDVNCNLEELRARCRDEANRVDELAKQVEQVAERLVRYGNHNGQRQAFTHALWMYRVTREFGPDVAKSFGDAYEMRAMGPVGERLMNLFNNGVGRVMAKDATNHGLSDINLILNSLQEGALQTWADPSYALIPSDKTTVGARKYHGFL
ncbi:uncharacterized protein [Ptychodera flava]|uniref:uncharacterized protein n=1 Tax=Ptychodera flava TaxID=63121 RepID=UPI00396AA2DE